MSALFDAASSGATFSPDRVYRYHLWRTWAPGPRLVVIGLNPSTADETVDDPTIRRCLGFARSWGLVGLDMLNLFAFRATDPRGLRSAKDPVGPHNIRTLLQFVGVGAPELVVLAAWGANTLARPRGVALARMCPRLVCLARNADGSPKHPLYARGDSSYRPWETA